MSPSSPSLPVSSLPRFALLGGRGVELSAASCIAARSGQAACRQCADACPVDAVEIRESGPRVAAACIGCGRCGASCATGALRVEGFAASLTAIAVAGKGDARPLTVACWKMPKGLAQARVPCLHGVSPSDWLRLIEAGATRGRLVVCDAGWCGSCDAGKGIAGFPGLERAAVWAASLGVPAERLPAVRRIDAGADCPDEIPSTADSMNVSRRAFLRRVFDDFETRTAPGAQTAPEFPGAIRRWAQPDLPERRALLAAMRRLQARYHGSMPTDATFASITVSDACCGSEVCVGVCPIGALGRYQTETTGGLELDSDRCVACGLCEQHCPSGALRVAASAPGAPASGPRAISTHRIARCTRCQADFLASHGQSLCTRCNADQQMARSLFGARHRAPTTHQPNSLAGGCHE